MPGLIVAIAMLVVVALITGIRIEGKPDWRDR